MKNKEIAEIFNRIGTALEMRGENVFKVRAYYKAAETLAELGEDIEAVRREERLKDISGIGVSLQEKIIEYLDTGKVKAYEDLLKEVPETFFDIVTVPSVGPKKAKLFLEQLNIKSLPELKKAAMEGRLLELPGIKKKTVENILNGVRMVEAGQERMDLDKATRLADAIEAQLKKLPQVKKICSAGSLRRGKETVRDIDILIETSDPAKVMQAFTHLPEVKKINALGETKSSIVTGNNVQVDLRVVESRCSGAALLYFTGNKNFNIRLRGLAKDRGLKVSEYGIFGHKGQGEEFLAGKTEEECFRFLGLPYIPPELREDMGQDVIFAKLGDLKIPRLLELKDIQGDLHVHSDWSDGHQPIETMAASARARGYSYVAVSDHSAGLKIAGGLTIKDLLAKKREIDRLNKKLSPFRILFGTEVDIDNEGNLDYNDEVLKKFDVVIAALHSGLHQDKKRMTRRIIKACQNKYVHVIAHPTGVQFGRREAYDLDFKEVCRVARETNTFLEMNAFPIRFDLNSTNAYYAREQGVRFAINTDSHSTDHLEYMRYGVILARRAWLTPKHVLNTLPLPDLLKAIRK